MGKISIRNAEFNKRGLQELVGWITRPNSKLKNIVMAEIGCYVGESTSIFAEKVKEVYAIDPWKNGYDDHDGASYKHKMDDVYAQFQENTKRFKNIVTVRKPSLEAVVEFEDHSLDFVYIDGEHTYTAVKKDIMAWLPKVKPGAYIGGHDISMGGVAHAIFEHFKGVERVFSDSSWVVRVK